MHYYRTSLVVPLLFALIASTAFAGWGDLVKVVAQDVVKEKVKEEATGAVVSAFTKDSPEYEGPKTAEEAEAAANGLLVDTEVLALEPLDVSKDLNGAKQFRRLGDADSRVAVVGFRVVFVLSNTASASENNALLNLGNSSASASGFKTVHQDRTVKMEKLLQGIDEATMQAIADAAYTDFMAKLAASGREVVPVETILAAEDFEAIEKTGVNPYKKDSGWFRPNDIYVYSPQALPLWFGHFDANGFGNVGPLSIGNWKRLNSISVDQNAVLVIPQIVINFAAMQSSGRNKLFRKAEVSSEEVVHAVPATTLMHGFHAKKKVAGDLYSVSLKERLDVPGKFAVNYLVDETDNAAWVNSLTRLTGAAGNIHSTETWAVVANPDVFKAYALAAAGGASQAFVELLKQ